MARTFGGVSTDRIAYGSYAAIDDLNTLSISIWTYRTGNGGGGAGRMVARENGSTFSFALNNTTTTYNFTARRWATTDGIWTIGRPSASTWAQIGVSYDYGSTTNDPEMYTNGTPVTETETATPAGTPLDSDAGIDTSIGNESAGTRNWAGRLAECGIWSVILDALEFAALGKGLCPLLIRPESLVFYSPVWGSASPEPNYMDAASGTLTGTVASGDHPKIIYKPQKKIFLPATAAAAATPKRLLLLGVG